MPADPAPGPRPEPDIRSCDTQSLHATTIALDGMAAMITGPSGSGKSDLALRCLTAAPNALIEATPLLVSDDRTLVNRTANGLTASAPATIRGRLEVRGLGIIRVPTCRAADVRLIVELAERTPERHPETPLDSIEVCGLPVSRLVLRGFEAASPLKLLLALADSARFTRSHPAPG